MEDKVASTLLEEKKVIVIEGESYEMKSPSIATLVLASKYIKDISKENIDSELAIAEMIQNADDLESVGYALSAMILGVKEFNKKTKRSLLSINKKAEKRGHVLAEKINNAPIKEVFASFVKVLELMNLTDFFQLTTFLKELNMTKPTKRVV